MKKENSDTRSSKEIAAEIAKTEAETRKTLAEAAKAESEATLAMLEAGDEERKHRRAAASDERNHLYRFGGEVNKSTVSGCIRRLTEWSRITPECNIEIIFSSPGGSIIDGFELFDFLQDLRNKGHHITTGTLGMAASMAGILLQAGDTRWVGGQAWIMIHRAAFGAFGKTYEVEDEVEFVKRIEGRILDIFTARSRLTKQKIKRNWDRKDWWISADEGLEMQLVDEIRAILPEKRSKAPKRTEPKRKSPKKARGK